jgi:hypothetical protein
MITGETIVDNCVKEIVFYTFEDVYDEEEYLEYFIVNRVGFNDNLDYYMSNWSESEVEDFFEEVHIDDAINKYLKIEGEVRFTHNNFRRELIERWLYYEICDLTVERMRMLYKFWKEEVGMEEEEVKEKIEQKNASE